MTTLKQWLLMWVPVLLLLPLVAARARQEQKHPTLGAFAVPVSFTVQVSGQTYQFTSSAITFTPGSGNNRTVSGVGTLVLAAPSPVPVPVPVPIPTPTPTPTPVPVPPPVPTPVPPGALNVRSYGAIGNDLTDDTAALQRAVSAAHAGDTVFFPSGTYRLTDWVKMNHPVPCTLLGAGPSSILHSAAGGGLMIGTGGEPGGPVTVRQLCFSGTPGATMKSAAPPTGGIQVYGPAGTLVDNCDFHDVMSAVYDADPSKNTTVKNSRVSGWSRICFFLGDGDTLLNDTCTQTDPNVNGQQTSHGVYCHASNCLIQGCSFYNCRKYGAQIYSEEIGRVMDNDRFINDTFVGCHDGGITLDHSMMGAGDIHNALIQGCTIQGTTSGAGIAVKNGDGVAITNCLIDGSPSYGIAIGLYAPYDTGFAVQNVTVSGCTISHCQTGLITYPSNGGTLANVVVQGTKYLSNNLDLSQQGSTSGIKILP